MDNSSSAGFVLVPAKALGVGASLCLKKAYFMTAVDVAPTSHYPFHDVSSRVIHDVLAASVARLTYAFLNGNYVSVSDFLRSKVESILNETLEALESYTAVNENREKVKEKARKFVSGYLALINSLNLSRTSPLRVYAERYLFSLDPEFPTVGVPDVLVEWGDTYIIVDWKLTGYKGDLRASLYQLASYRELVKRAVEMYSGASGSVKTCAYLIYVTDKRGDVKVIDAGGDCKLDVKSLEREDVKYVDKSRELLDAGKRLSAVARAVSGMLMYRTELKKLVGELRNYGVKAYRSFIENGKIVYGSRLCKACSYAELCAYRFTKSEELPEDLRAIKRFFRKAFIEAVKRKSSDKLFDTTRCATFQRVYFREDPRTLYLEADIGGAGRSDKVLQKVMSYVLGKSAVYVFLCGERLGGSICNSYSAGTPKVLSPIVFGRFESDEVEFDGRKIMAKVRMVSSVFANRWLPLFYLYREMPNDSIFKGKVLVCRGSIPLDLEIKALSVVERALISKVGERQLGLLDRLIREVVAYASAEVD